MKKFWIVIVSCFLCLCFFGLVSCNQEKGLEPYVSQLTNNLYHSESQNYNLKAVYGYKEINPNQDGKVGQKAYYLTFRLFDKQTNMQTYSLQLEFAKKNYGGDFTVNPVSHTLTLDLEIEGFVCDSFDVKITCGDQTEVIKMTSPIPKNTLGYKKALLALQKEQGSLIKSYYDNNGNFTAEIYLRILVKDGKAYWYVGLAQSEKQLKALLLDGETGKVLAIREVF